MSYFDDNEAWITGIPRHKDIFENLLRNQQQGKQLNITILSVDIKTKPNSRGGTYQDAEVAFKNNTYQGKVEGKSVRSLGAKEAAFKVLATAQPGETYEVQVVKNEKGFNDWVSLQKSQPGVAAPNVPTVQSKSSGATAAPRSTYETPEERAKKQVYIIRQSSVSSAIAIHSVGAKTLGLDPVLDTAKRIETYVLGHTNGATGATGFDDVPDLDPEFQEQLNIT